MRMTVAGVFVGVDYSGTCAATVFLLTQSFSEINGLKHIPVITIKSNLEMFTNVFAQYFIHVATSNYS